MSSSSSTAAAAPMGSGSGRASVTLLGALPKAPANNTRCALGLCLIISSFQVQILKTIQPVAFGRGHTQELLDLLSPGPSARCSSTDLSAPPEPAGGPGRSGSPPQPCCWPAPTARPAGREPLPARKRDGKKAKRDVRNKRGQQASGRHEVRAGQELGSCAFSALQLNTALALTFVTPRHKKFR